MSFRDGHVWLPKDSVLIKHNNNSYTSTCDRWICLIKSMIHRKHRCGPHLVNKFRSVRLWIFIYTYIHFVSLFCYWKLYWSIAWIVHWEAHTKLRQRKIMSDSQKNGRIVYTAHEIIVMWHMDTYSCDIWINSHVTHGYIVMWHMDK